MAQRGRGKKYICDCEKHCRRLKEVSRSTYVRHAPYRIPNFLGTPHCDQTPNSLSREDELIANASTCQFSGNQTGATPYSSVRALYFEILDLERFLSHFSTSPWPTMRWATTSITKKTIFGQTVSIRVITNDRSIMHQHPKN